MTYICGICKKEVGKFKQAEKHVIETKHYGDFEWKENPKRCICFIPQSKYTRRWEINKEIESLKEDLRVETNDTVIKNLKEELVEWNKILDDNERGVYGP